MFSRHSKRHDSIIQQPGRQLSERLHVFTMFHKLFHQQITSLNRYDKTGLVKQLVGWILKTLDLSIFVHLFTCEPEKKKNDMRLILMSKIAKKLRDYCFSKSAGSNCLTNVPTLYDETEYQSSLATLPGQRFTLNNLCALMHGVLRGKWA